METQQQVYRAVVAQPLESLPFNKVGGNCYRLFIMQLITTVEGEVNTVTIYDLLDDDTRRKLNAKAPVVHRSKRKDKRKYSERELKELMGCNRDTYKRVNGKVKRK